MAHTDRQPTDEVFEDIKKSAIQMWYMHRELHEDYIKEKTEPLYDLTNYADNWYTAIGRMDIINQMAFWHLLKLKVSEDFLRKMNHHYGYFVPREKI